MPNSGTSQSWDKILKALEECIACKDMSKWKYRSRPILGMFEFTHLLISEAKRIEAQDNISEYVKPDCPGIINPAHLAFERFIAGELDDCIIEREVSGIVEHIKVSDLIISSQIVGQLWDHYNCVDDLLKMD